MPADGLEAGRRWLRGLAVVLAGVLLLELVLPDTDPESELPAARSPVALAPDDRAVIDAGQLAALATTIRARPLFIPTRRAQSAVVPPAEVRTAMPRLSAIIVGQSERLAVFSDARDGTGVVVRTGDTIGGNVLVAIAPGQVTVVGPDGARTLRPAFDAAAVVVPAPAQVAQAAPKLPVDGSQQTLLDRVLNR